MDVLLPIVVIESALNGARRGFRTGGWLNQMIYGEGVKDLEEGFRYMNKLFETQDLDFADKALQCFGRIKASDKKYIVAQALYCEAICYAVKGKYGLAYDDLDRVDRIEIRRRFLGIGTQKPEIIRQIQGKTLELRSEIQCLENNGNILLQEYKEKKRLLASPNAESTSPNNHEPQNEIFDKLDKIEKQLSRIDKELSSEIKQLHSDSSLLRDDLQKLQLNKIIWLGA